MKKMSTIRKSAGPGIRQSAASVKDIMLMVGGLALANEALQGVKLLGKATIGKKLKQRQQESSYKGMLESNRSIKGTPEARRAFNTLHTFSPAMANDPLVSGSFVKRTVDFGEMVDPKQIQDIAKTQTYISGSPRPVDPMSALTGSPAVQHMMGTGSSKTASVEQRRVDRARAHRHTTEKLAEIRGKYR